MSTTRWPTRLVFFFLAMLFLIPIIASGVYVIYQSNNDNTQQEDSSLDNNNTLAGTQLANFTPLSAPVTELQITDTTVGNGDEVKAGDTVTVSYTGALATSGIIFESSMDSGQLATFPLDQVIKGWTDGLPGMKVGGTRRLVIPAAQAYGATGQGTIPPNADLVFDVTLISIGQ